MPARGPPAVSIAAVWPGRSLASCSSGHVGLQLDRAVLDDAEQRVPCPGDDRAEPGRAAADDAGDGGADVGSGEADQEFLALRAGQGEVGLGGMGRVLAGAQAGRDHGGRRQALLEGFARGVAAGEQFLGAGQGQIDLDAVRLALGDPRGGLGDCGFGAGDLGRVLRQGGVEDFAGQAGQDLAGGDVVAFFDQEFRDGEAFDLRADEDFFFGDEGAGEDDAFRDAAGCGRHDGDAGGRGGGAGGLGVEGEGGGEQHEEHGARAQEAVEEDFQDGAAACGREGGVEALMDAEAVAHCHDELAGGFDVERRVNRAALLAAFQGGADVGAGLDEVAVEHAADLGVAGGFGHDLGAEGGVGAGEDLLQLVQADAGQGFDRVLGGGESFEEGGVLLPLGLGDGGDDADLAGEVAVEGAGAHAGLGADLLHGGAVESAAGEACDGGVDDALAGGCGGFWLFGGRHDAPGANERSCAMRGAGCQGFVDDFDGGGHYRVHNQWTPFVNDRTLPLNRSPPPQGRRSRVAGQPVRHFAGSLAGGLDPDYVQ